MVASLLGLWGPIACAVAEPPGPSKGHTPAAEPEAPSHPPAVASAIRRGEELFFGKAVCATCHRVNDEGSMIVGPNLGIGDGMTEPVARRAHSRAPELSPPQYVIDSILDPDAIVVSGYAPGVMKSPRDIPVALSDDDLVGLAAYLLSLGAQETIPEPVLQHARERIPVAQAARDRRRAGGR